MAKCFFLSVLFHSVSDVPRHENIFVGATFTTATTMTERKLNATMMINECMNAICVVGVGVGVGTSHHWK